MVKLFTLANCFIAAFVGQSTGHFLLDYPPGVGFDDDTEGNAPCGGFSVDFSKINVTDFHVGGDVLAMVRKHSMNKANSYFAAINTSSSDMAIPRNARHYSFWKLDQSHACCSSNWIG
jgi:hypothetical protein